MKASHHPANENVFDLFSGLPLSQKPSRRIIRLAPELDHLEMLYSNEANPGKLFAVKILCWALCEDGEVFGMIPWLNKLLPCTSITDPLNGQWEGYYSPSCDDIFFEAPMHKIAELETAAEFYGYEEDSGSFIVQAIPDSIGTHAAFSIEQKNQLYLTGIVSWQLKGDGQVDAMIIDPDSSFDTPVLPDDTCLLSVNKNPGFRYFFQHHIANKIKASDPEALAAIAILIGDNDNNKDKPH